MPRRRAWTRIEVVVVIVVILTALGIVAVLLQTVRGPSQRVECGMNIHRMGETIQAYHEQHKSLPASCIAPGYATWAVQIAPFLQQDQGKALKGWDLNLSYYDQTAEVRAGQVAVFYCPARRVPGQLSTSGDVPPTDGLLANFAGALGDYGCAPTSDNVTNLWTSPDADGALIVGEVLEKQGDKIIRWKSRTTLQMLEYGPGRGLAVTILLGEKHVRPGDFGQVKFGDGSLYNGDHPASFARIVDKDHALAKDPRDSSQLNFGSWHKGICQFLMADGSLKVIEDGINPVVLQQLIPRAMPKEPK
ncbi:MAG TPA: DUF1559 domain-containing protein [Gemmataceae bacterium]|nr:DUF1559 domain-containing protein [Gemmataceae bacterium]